MKLSLHLHFFLSHAAAGATKDIWFVLGSGWFWLVLFNSRLSSKISSFLIRSKFLLSPRYHSESIICWKSLRYEFPANVGCRFAFFERRINFLARRGGLFFRQTLLGDLGAASAATQANGAGQGPIWSAAVSGRAGGSALGP